MPFERQKAEVHIFERANLLGSATWELTAKEDLNPQKQVFLINLRLKNLVYFLWEKVYMRTFCSVKAKGSWFKN